MKESGLLYFFLLWILHVGATQPTGACVGRFLIDYQHGMYSYHHHLVFTTLIEFIMKVFGKTFYFLIFFYLLKLFASLLKPNHVNLVKIILKQLNEKTCIKYLTSVMSSESLSSLSRIKINLKRNVFRSVTMRVTKVVGIVISNTLNYKSLTVCHYMAIIKF